MTSTITTRAAPASAGGGSLVHDRFGSNLNPRNSKGGTKGQPPSYAACPVKRRRATKASVVALRSSNALDDLANKINVCVSKLDNYRATVAVHLADAKALCKVKGVTFKAWVKDNIKLSYHETVRLAKVGESDDPTKAIADMREKTRARQPRHRAKVASRDATTTIEIIEEPDDAEDEPESSNPSQLPTHMRIRGLLHRAGEAEELARADDMAGIEATQEMRNAAANAAKAWSELLERESLLTRIIGGAS